MRRGLNLHVAVKFVHHVPELCCQSSRLYSSCVSVISGVLMREQDDSWKDTNEPMFSVELDVSA